MVATFYIDKPTLGVMGKPLTAYPSSLGDTKFISLDIETWNPQGLSGLDFHTASVSTIQMCNEKQVLIYDIIALGKVPDPVRQLLEDETVVKVIHNASFEYNMLLMAEGITLKNFYCTMIAEQVLQNGKEQRFSYAALTKRYCKVELDKTVQKLNWGNRPLTPMQTNYIINDVLYLPQIYREQQKKWDNYNKKLGPALMDNFKMEMQALPDFCEIERTGVYFNLEKTRALCDKYEAQSSEALGEIQKLLPMVPITSTDKSKYPKGKWKEIYPDEMKYPANGNDFKKALEALGVTLPTIIDKRTRKERKSLSADTYHLLDHPSRPFIQAYVATQKLLTSYIYPLLEEKLDKKKMDKLWIHPIKGKAYPSIKQTGTTTARPAFLDPPLQTIPKLEEFREQIEVEYDDYFLVKADYSQIELRVGAVVANDQKLIQAFINDEDIHLKTAHEVLGIELSAITKELRDKAKPVNFGFLFDQSGEGFQQYALTDYGVEFTLAESREYKKNYLNTYTGIKKYHWKVKSDTRYSMYHKKTYISQGLTGRVRLFPPGSMPLVHKGPGTEVEDYYTVCKDAINFPIQNGNAEAMKRAMLMFNYHAKKEGLDAQVILLVHDEKVLNAHKKDLKRAIQILHACMIKAANQVLQNKVPVKVEICYGKDWAHMKRAV